MSSKPGPWYTPVQKTMLGASRLHRLHQFVFSVDMAGLVFLTKHEAEMSN